MSDTPADIPTPDPVSPPRPAPAATPADWGRIALLTILWGSAFATIEVALETV